jgi:ketopantoate reductase
VPLETSWSISCTSGGQLRKSLLRSINLAFRINHQRLWVQAISPTTEIWQIWQIWDSERSIVKRRTIQQSIRSEPNIKKKKLYQSMSEKSEPSTEFHPIRAFLSRAEISTRKKESIGGGIWKKMIWSYSFDSLIYSLKSLINKYLLNEEEESMFLN